MSINLHSLFNQLYQLTSALQLRLSKFNSLSLSTPFHFRFHNLIKWPFCSLLCYRYINSKQNGYHSSLIILFKMKTLFPIKFANTILSQLPRTCFAVLVLKSAIRKTHESNIIKKGYKLSGCYYLTPWLILKNQGPLENFDLNT